MPFCRRQHHCFELRTRRAALLTICGTVVAGVTMITSSGTSGSAAMFGYAFTPHTSARFAFTGNTAPLNDRKFSQIARPTLPSRSVAPMSAMLRGWKKETRDMS